MDQWVRLDSSAHKWFENNHTIFSYKIPEHLTLIILQYIGESHVSYILARPWQLCMMTLATLCDDPLPEWAWQLLPETSEVPHFPENKGINERQEWLESMLTSASICGPFLATTIPSILSLSFKVLAHSLMKKRGIGISMSFCIESKYIKLVHHKS